MKREVRLLLTKACDSLLLSIELFNRPNDRGRVSGVLIQIDHSFEMLLKAAILHKGGRIREKQTKETIGFETCVRRGLSDGGVKFLAEEQALTLQAINGLRDAAQHYLLDVSENQLYVHVHSGVTLFRDLIESVFQLNLAQEIPTRVLPVTTTVPTDLVTVFDSEVDEIRKLLQPGRRRRIEAEAKLRAIAVLDSTIRGEKDQPSGRELQQIANRLRNTEWTEVFPGAAAVQLVASSDGPALSIRWTRAEGTPIQTVPEGTPGSFPVAIKRVNELGYYNLGAKNLARKVGLTVPKTLAVIEYLKIRDDPDCYKVIAVGKTEHKRYSQTAIAKIKEALHEIDLEAIWNARQLGKKRT